MSLTALKQELRAHADAQRARVSMSFFKTKKGEYGAGDAFLGVPMGPQRRLARQYTELSFGDIGKLLASRWHEERMVGLLVLVRRFERGDHAKKKQIFEYYVRHKRAVNNWDLVDATAHKIIGAWLLDRPRTLLYTLARSNNLWDRRIAMVSTYAFIRKGEFEDALRIAAVLLDDTHDLIHKAAGWMLREVGKQNAATLHLFLEKHCRRMPRTMLRYAIEKFSPRVRASYMKGTV